MSKKVEEQIHSLKALYDTDGGKELVSLLAHDIVSKIERLSAQYMTLTHIEMIGIAASIAEKLELIRALKNSAQNWELLQEEIKKEVVLEEEE